MAGNKKYVPSMPGRNRPMLTCDKHGYPPEVGDAEWDRKHKRKWTRLPNGMWEKKD